MGPIITSPEARTHELDISLLERLFDRPLYADAVRLRGRLPLTGLPLHQDPAYIGFKPFANLVKVGLSPKSRPISYFIAELPFTSGNSHATFCDVLQRLSRALRN